MPNDNQTQTVNNSFWDKVESTPIAATGAAPSSASSAPAIPTPVPASQSQTPAVSHSFWDSVEGKTPSTVQVGQAKQSQGDIIDRAVAGTSLEPINRGIQQGVAAGFGLKAPDPNHPD